MLDLLGLLAQFREWGGTFTTSQLLEVIEFDWFELYKRGCAMSLAQVPPLCGVEKDDVRQTEDFLLHGIRHMYRGTESPNDSMFDLFEVLNDLDFSQQAAVTTATTMAKGAVATGVRPNVPFMLTLEPYTWVVTVARDIVTDSPVMEARQCAAWRFSRRSLRTRP